MFKQVKDILQEINLIYNRLYDFYDTLLKVTEDEKAREVIKYVKGNKKLFSDILNDYKKSGEKEVLETWLQFTPEYTLNKQLRNFEKTDNDINKINLLVIQFETWLLDFYDYIIRTTPSTKVKEIFERLHQRQHKNSKSISTAVKILQDF